MTDPKRWLAVALLLTVLVSGTGCLPLRLAEPLYGFYDSLWVPDSSMDASGDIGEPIFNSGPALTDPTKLPVDSSGKGTVVGVAPGEASWSDGGGDQKGSFQLILAPAPPGIPARSELQVRVDETTRYLLDGVDKGRVIDGLRGGRGTDPTESSMHMTVTFHIRGGDVWADSVNQASEDLNNP